MSVIDIEIPRNYGEMTDKQVRYVIALTVAGQEPEVIRAKCFLRFAGLKPVITVGDTSYFRRVKFPSIIRISVQDVAYFARQLGWLQSNYAGLRPPAKIARLHAPDSLLRNTLFMQYLEAENFYQAYIYKKEKKYLHSLIATLYQPADRYDNNLTDKLARKIGKRISDADEMLVLLWMIGVKQTFARMWDDLFERKVKYADDEDNDTPPNMMEIINNQVRMLTDGDLTKKTAILKSNTWDAIDELNAKVREVKELNKKYANK